MALVLILGLSGSGKSLSTRNLNPKETFYIKVKRKLLPYREGNKNYKDTEDKTCNMKVLPKAWTTKWDTLISYLIKLKNAEHIKNIIVDDFQYMMGDEYVDRLGEKDQFIIHRQIASNVKRILDVTENPTFEFDKNIFLLSHSVRDESGRLKMKTTGKLIDNTITIEGLFTFILHTMIMDGKHVFQTKDLNGLVCAKTPIDMFENETYIENDLQIVVDQLDNYFNINEDIPQ